MKLDGQIIEHPIDYKYAEEWAIQESIRPTDSLELGGVKKDLGKRRWSLLPWDAVEEVVKVLEFGAQKYADRNWEKGMDWDRLFDASMRHKIDLSLIHI